MNVSIYPSGAAASGCGEILRGAEPPRIAASLGLPSDLPGVCLAAGWLLVLLIGVGSLLAGELAGWLLVVAAFGGYLFLHARVLQVVLWAGVATALVALAALGNPLDLAAAGLSVFGAGTAAWSVVRTSEPSRMPSPFGGDPMPLAVPEPVVADPDGPGLRVETIGRIRILADGRDLTGTLMERRLLAYIWLYLLSRALTSPGARLRREALADQLSSGLEQREQLRRLRKQLFDLAKALPAEVAAPLDIDKQSLVLDLGRVAWVDVVQLREMADRARAGAIDETFARSAGAWLERWAGGQFLPEFAELEDSRAPGQTAGTELATTISGEVESLCGDLATSLAGYQLSKRDPMTAISVLERFADSGRDDIDRLLIRACIEAGQSERADRLRRQLKTTVEV